MPSAGEHNGRSLRRRMSWLLFKHVSREFLTPLVCALIAFAVLFALNNVMLNLTDFTRNGAPWNVIVLYYLSLQPSNLLNVIPFSMMLATSFMTLMLGRSNELCAMRAAGLSLAKCALPIWIVAVIATVMMVLLSEFWGPSCLKYAKELKSEFGEGRDERHEPVTLVNTVEKRDWYVEPVSKEESGDNSWLFGHTIVREYDKNGNPTSVLSAAQSEYLGHVHGWNFKNCVLLKYDAEGKSIKENFEKLEKKEYKERPDDFSSGMDTEMIFSTREAVAMLNRDVELPAKMSKILYASIWYNLTFPLACIVAACFGFSMTIAGQRSEMMRGFALGIAILALFYIVGQMFFVLGKNGVVPGWLSAVSNIMFAVLGVVHVWRKQ